MTSGRKRRRLLFSGIVQGVGFRPFIYRLALRHGLSGFVCNRPDGVIAEVEGPEGALQSFIHALPAELPPMADLTDMTISDTPPVGTSDFRIIPSDQSGHIDLHIAPDIATCPDCLAELFTEADRRFHYPFINCTNCGPRLTIIHDIPYDRGNTSMSCFPMCPACQAEYENPSDRRFHAEPNACPACGPSLTLLDENGQPMTSEFPLQKAIDFLRQGSILAIKGLGGFHLAVDAANDEAVRRLRARKFREEKPLALMVRDMGKAHQIADIDKHEEALLLSVQRPIVLVKRKRNIAISPAVAPGMPNLGIMLAYSPLHHLLLHDDFDALVMTSGNQTDEPICIGNREAVDRLSGIADCFLVHNRDILVRCDDSIAGTVGNSAYIQRRSRGYAPKPIRLHKEVPQILAVGPHLKSTICLLKDRFAFLSPHIGDLETPQARDFFHETIDLVTRVTACKPQILACDLHPGYYSTQTAIKMAQEADDAAILHQVQHHHAHIVSCMADNGLSGDVIGLAMDGTGYGSDGHVWGGEFFAANERTFIRMGHFRECALPGGDKAIREPWRIGASLLRTAYGSSWQEIAERLRMIPQGTDSGTLERMMDRGLNSPQTSSLGRIFDGIAAILGERRRVTFEGQAAMELEGAAQEAVVEHLPYAIIDAEVLQLDVSPAVRRLAEEKIGGAPAGPLIYAFHETLAEAFMKMAKRIRERSGLNRVVLSGGCFQNRLLLGKTLLHMRKAGFDAFPHRLVPTNDGGISLGQAVCAAARTTDVAAP